MNGFDQPTEEMKKIPWKPIGIVGGSVLVALLVIVGIVLFVRSRQSAELDQQRMERTLSQVERLLESCDQKEDPEACREQRLREAAQGTALLEVCEMIEDTKAQNDCIWRLAREQNTIQACDAISEPELVQACRDNLTYLAVKKDPLNQSCESIVSQRLKSQCERMVLDKRIETEGCESVYDAEYCQNYELLQRAISQDDYALCERISDSNLYSECLLVVENPIASAPAEPVDTDDDGLSDQDEITIWGTDPSNPDTDGDGFLDGQEVESGYNPLGEGAL